MSSDSLLKNILQDIDQQLSLLNLEDPTLESIASNLLNLRNTILSKYSFMTKENLIILNTDAQKIIKKMGWKEVWVGLE